MRKLLTFLFTLITVLGFSQGITVTVGDVVGSADTLTGTISGSQVIGGVSAENTDSLGGEPPSFYVDTATNQDISGTKTFTQNVGIGTTTPSSRLEIIETVVGAAAIKNTVNSELTISSGTQSVEANTIVASLTLTGATISSGSLENSLSGITGGFTHGSTGTVAEASGVAGVFSTTTATPIGTVTTGTGIVGVVIHATTGTITTANALRGVVQNLSTGTITNAIGLDIQDIVNSGGGTVTNAYGIRIADITGGTNDRAIKTGTGIVEFGDDLKLVAYPNTRDDGTLINILGTDASGNLITGPNEVLHIGVNVVDTADQAINVASIPQAVTFNKNLILEGVSHPVSDSIFTINTSGVYQIVVAPQLAQGSGSAIVEFWIRKNGVDIPHSNVEESISANSESLPLLRWKERLVATDTIEIIWASNSVNTLLDNIASSYGGPNIPSITIGMTHQGNGL